MVAPYVPISDIVPWNQFIAGLNQFIYSTNWTANNASDVVVYSRAQGIPTNDVIQLVNPNNYTVQFIGSDNVVQVTFNSMVNPPQYNIVTIMRNNPSEFLNLYTNTNFTPSMLNSDFENLVQVDQQNQLYWQQIVPRYNNSATVNVPIDTILPILKANEFWIKNSTNTAFIAATLGEGGEFPVLGPFVLYTANQNYPEAFSLGSLTSGILAQNVLLGSSTPYIIPIPIDVENGGTGLETITPYALLTGSPSGNDPIVHIENLGNIGDVLTSSGPGSLPSFQTLPVLSGVPIGTIIDYAGTDLPDSYLICNGGSYSTTTYSSLFSVIGYTWGGSGANFNVPNLAGYVTAGAGGTLPPLSNTVGSTGGSATHVLTINEMPSHSHNNTQSTARSNSGNPGGSASLYGASAGPNQNLPIDVSAQGGGVAHTIVQPTAIVQKLIKFQ